MLEIQEYLEHFQELSFQGLIVGDFIIDILQYSEIVNDFTVVSTQKFFTLMLDTSLRITNNSKTPNDQKNTATLWQI